MARISLISLAIVLIAGWFVQPNQATSDPKTVCYYESWVHWRTGDGKLDPSELDSSMCTHLVYAYFGIEPVSHEIKILDPYLMNDLHDLEKFVNMKGNGKAMIAIGGASQSSQFSITASNEFNRDAFVKSVVRFLADHRFDGVIIDWSGMAASDSDNLVKLLDKFDELFASTSYTLAISVPATIATFDFYNIPKIVNYVDFINVVSLDYAGPWSKIVGHASPFHTQLGTLEQYHKRGAPKSKLVMAVPTYARTWRLAHLNKQSPGDEAIGGGPAGPYTQVEGLLSYNELCVMIKSSPSSYSITRDSHETAVYAVKVSGNSAEWISYEDSHTLAIKAKNITEQGYAGMSIYTLSNEDVHGTCGKKNPLLHAINENYYRGHVTEGPFTTITPVTHVTEHVTDVPGVFKCHSVGKFRDPVYCFKYYECIMGDFGLESTIYYCERTEAFDEASKSCVNRSKIPGC